MITQHNQAAGGNLRAQGFRLMVRKEFNQARWVHPIEAKVMVGFVDCTDMSDAEFEQFMTAAEVVQ